MRGDVRPNCALRPFSSLHWCSKVACGQPRSAYRRHSRSLCPFPSLPAAGPTCLPWAAGGDCAPSSAGVDLQDLTQLLPWCPSPPRRPPGEALAAAAAAATLHCQCLHGELRQQQPGRRRYDLLQPSSLLYTPPNSAARSQPQKLTCQTMLRCCADLPLHEAVKAGDVQELKRALAAGADVEAMDPHGRGSAVMYAAGLGQEECLQALLEAGASPDVRFEAFGASMTPLCIAASGRPGCVRLLLRHSADSHARSEGGGTPLIAAAAGGHLEGLEALIEGGADILEATPEYDQTALHFAALNGHPACVQALIKVTK